MQIISIAFIALSLATASYTLPANNGITITGTATDSFTRAPIQGVAISTNVSGVSFKAATDNLGKYTLNITFNRKPALIILLASKKNYLPSVHLLTNIQPNRSYTADFSLRDITPPSKPTVTDDGDFLVASNILHARWFSEDPESGIRQYYYSVGTRAGSTDIIKWTSSGKNTEIALSNLTLIHNKTYYFNVRAVNNVGLISSIGSSDGITINAHIPEISRIIPYTDSTYKVGDSITIEVTAQDQDSDPIQYQFSVDGQIKQLFSPLNTYNYTVEPSSDNKHKITVEVRDDKNGLISQEVTYNVQNIVIDTTPPSAPNITTNPQSSSLNSIEASWSSDDPESGIAEYQYAIGTTPGGTDIVYWSTYGNNTQAFLSGLNLTQGQPYYLSVVAKNGAGLKGPISTSPAITAQKEPYIKIYYPYQNAIITDKQVVIKGVAEGVSQITINGKSVAVNADGSFQGPTLVAPGYAARNNITSDDPNYIIMNFPGQTTITASADGEEDTVSFYYYQIFVKWDYRFQDVAAPPVEYQQWNNNSLTNSPFDEWEQPDCSSRGHYAWLDPSLWLYSNPDFGYYCYDYRSSSDFPSVSSLTIHTLPSIDGKILPMLILFKDCSHVQIDYHYTTSVPDISLFKINGVSLAWLYGAEKWENLNTGAFDYPNCAYAVLDNYTPDTDINVDIYVPPVQNQPSYISTEIVKHFDAKIYILILDTVREIPYGSGNYVPVKTIPIFQPDDGKGRGPSTELVNMPFLKVKFAEVPSDTQINTLEAKISIADEAKTYNLTETAPDSDIFTEPTNSFSLVIPANAGIQVFNPNAQDELTCSVTSSFGNLNNKLFNLKESASDSLYFNDIKTFVTVTFNDELLPYQADTLTIQYDNGMLASEETLTETSPDSLVFSNEDSSFTIKLNNYQTTLPDSLDITINNTDYLEISKAELILPKVNSSPYVYTNEPMDGGSDLPPNNPLDDGQGVFKVQVKGLPANLSSDVISSLPITLSTDLGSKTLELSQQADSSYMTPPVVILPAGDSTSNYGINSLNSASGEDKIKLDLKNVDAYTIIEQLKNAVKPAFVGSALSWEWLFASKLGDTTGNVASILRKKLDYPVVSDGWLTKQDFLNALPKYSLWYSVSHGGQEDFIFKTVSVKKDWMAWMSKDIKLWNVYPEDVRDNIQGNSYDFVFLNCCLSADPTSQANTQGFIDYFGAKTYLGWLIAVDPSSALHYGRRFFDESAKPNKQKKPSSVDDVWNSLQDQPQGTKTKYYGDGTFVIDLKKR